MPNTSGHKDSTPDQYEIKYKYQVFVFIQETGFNKTVKFKVFMSPADRINP